MNAIKTRKMYALEYKSFDGAQTFDIFETFENAQKRAEKIKDFGHKYKPLFVFKAKFNLSRIFKENDSWNYDDCSDTCNLSTMKILKYLG